MSDTKIDNTNVLLVAPFGAGLHYHGAGTTFYRMYSHRLNQEMSVSLLHGATNQNGAGCYREEVFLTNSKSGPVGQMKFVATAKRWLRANAQRFDVVHATSGYLVSLKPAAFAESIGLPAVLTIASHGGDLGGRASWIGRLFRTPQFRRKLAAQLSAVVATSQDIHNELMDVGVQESRIHRIPYGVDTDVFTSATDPEKRLIRRELGLDEDLPTIVFVGDAVRRKRPMLIVQALAENIRAGREAQIVFVGPTSDQEYLSGIQQYAGENKLTPYLHWAGLQTDVARYLRAADLFVLPSAAEGLPNAMLEAMACGLPVIGTAISGINDLIQVETNGLIIEPHVESLSNALRYFLDDMQRAKVFGEQSRFRIENEYALNVVIPKYAQLFKAVAEAT